MMRSNILKEMKASLDELNVGEEDEKQSKGRDANLFHGFENLKLS